MSDTASLIGLLISFALAGLVAVSELISRYRDKPLSALRAPGTLAYVSINGLAAAAAFWLMYAFDVTFGATATAVEPTRVLVATFGSIAFFRSSLFLTRIGDTDIGIGPSAVISTLLGAADRSVDRRRAARRSVEVSHLFGSISFERAVVALPTMCLLLLQNVSQDEQEKLFADVEAIRIAPMSERQQSLALGLKLISFAGPDVVAAAIRALGGEIQPKAPQGH
jgi:hypothetical protein